MTDELILRPIGGVVRDQQVTPHIDPSYRPALTRLADFSHVIVLWWASGHDEPASREITRCELPHARGVEVGCSPAGRSTDPTRLR